MSRFRIKPTEVEVITFDELVQFAIDAGAPLVEGVPWAFEYQSYAFTHETNDRYTYATRQGTRSFERGEMLVTDPHGELFPCTPEDFALHFEAVEPLEGETD